MASFFDLNLPYTAAANSAAASNRNVRLRSVVTLLELGYAGAAYNLSLRGVLSDRDRCAIVPFPLSSLLSAAPSLGASASFHRSLLSSGKSDDPAFRQFSRVTVSVDTVAAASAIGSTSAVLRGYDIVAVRPQSQSAFEHVCKFSEVDLISVDFSQKVPFRLKQQSVKLAIKRGVFFEITYSQLLSDNANSKRQVLCDAKMLADWTRGKNLIVSSGASNANEVRGPNDVSNLISFLLGLSKERAKAAISDNCRSLLAKALRKKNFYKETIRIEKMPAKEPFSIGDWIKWDPISSGEGDLPSLEEISKNPSFANPKPSNSNSNKLKAVDFSSIVHEEPFILSQHGDKLHKTEPVCGDREEIEEDGMQLDDQLAQMKASFLKDDNIGLVRCGSDQSHATLHPPHKIEVQLKNQCNFEEDNSAPDGMQLDDQVALLTECDSKDDDITIVPGNPNQPEGTLHNNMEAPLKECNFEIDNSALQSDGFQKELCTDTDMQCDSEVPLSTNSTDLERFVDGPDSPLIQSEHKTDQNATEGIVGICDETMAVASINNEATVKENNFSIGKLIDEVYTETKVIEQLNDEKDGEVENVDNRDALVETGEVERDTSKINLIDDEERMREKVDENIDVKEVRERELDIIKLDDTGEAVDVTSTSGSISSMEAVLHDLRGKQDWEIPTFALESSCTSRSKGKRKQKGLPVHQPHTMPFKGPFKHMLFRKKARR